MTSVNIDICNVCILFLSYFVICRTSSNSVSSISLHLFSKSWAYKKYGRTDWWTDKMMGWFLYTPLKLCMQERGGGGYIKWIKQLHIRAKTVWSRHSYTCLNWLTSFLNQLETFSEYSPPFYQLDYGTGRVTIVWSKEDIVIKV